MTIAKQLGDDFPMSLMILFLSVSAIFSGFVSVTRSLADPSRYSKGKPTVRPAAVLVGLSFTVTACDKLPFLTQAPAIKDQVPVGHLTGRVLLPDGKPAANIIIKIFPATGHPSTYRVAGVETETVSDASGRFAFEEVPAGQLNIEAAKSSELKVFKSNVTPSKEKPTDLGDLALQPTGSITGKVSAPYAPTVKNFEGVDVFIPGSSYVAKADTTGNYTITNVAVGRFNLVASKAGLGRASIDGIEVQSKKSTEAPVMELSIAQPKILAVSPNNAGPSAEVSITGENFGASTGDTYLVNINGTIAVSTTRIDDQTIKCIVPNGATSGNVVVTVNGLKSNGTGFQVLKTLFLSMADAELLVGRTEIYEASASDTADAPVNDPVLQWRVISGCSATVTAGRVTALSPGDSTIQISSGNLALAGRLHVFQISSVILNKSHLTLNAMPEEGDPDPGFITSDTLVARVQVSDSSARGVSWTSSDPSKVTVVNGLLQTTRGATEGEVTITATSVDDPSKRATASVSVTTDSNLSMGVN